MKRFFTRQNIFIAILFVAIIGFLYFSYVQEFYPETGAGRIGKWIFGAIATVIAVIEVAIKIYDRVKVKPEIELVKESNEVDINKQDEEVSKVDPPSVPRPQVPVVHPPEPPAKIDFSSPDAMFESFPDMPPLLLERMIKEFVYGVRINNWSGTVEWVTTLQEGVDVRVGFFSGKKSFVSASFGGNAIHPIALHRKGDNINVDGTIFEIDITIQRVWLLSSTYKGDKPVLSEMPVQKKHIHDPQVWTPGWEFLAKMLIHFSEDPDEELQVHELAEIIETTHPDYTTANVMHFREMLIHWEYLELEPGAHIYIPGPRIASLY